MYHAFRKHLGCYSHVLLAAAALACAAAHRPVLAQDDSTAQTAPLEGSVLDSVTHQPIARVLVQYAGRALLTDNNGLFSFGEVPVGQVGLTAYRPGYFDPVSGQTRAHAQLDLAAGGGAQTILLEPAAYLHGHLVLADGDSASGMRIALYEASVQDGRRSWHVHATTTPAPDGSFAFDGLAPGAYLLHSEVSLDPVPEGTGPGRRAGYPPVWAPNAEGVSGASIYTLQAGQTVGAELQLQRRTFYPVRVTLQGAAEERSSCRISGNGFEDLPLRTSFRDEEDAVSTELPNGSYLLRCTAGSRGEGAAGVLALQVDGAPVTGANLILGPSTHASVTVAVDTSNTDDSGAPGTSAPRLQNIVLYPTDGLTAPVFLGAHYEADGTISLQNVIPSGRYWVAADVSGGYLAEFTANGTDLLSQPLTVTNGSITFAALLRTDFGSLTVTREGGLAGKTSMVQVIPLSPDGVYRGASGSLSGSSVGAPLQVDGLPPGDYLVFATTSFRDIAFREPGIVPRLTGARVTILPGQTAPVTLSAFTSLPADSAGAP